MLLAIPPPIPPPLALPSLIIYEKSSAKLRRELCVIGLNGVCIDIGLDGGASRVSGCRVGGVVSGGWVAGRRVGEVGKFASVPVRRGGDLVADELASVALGPDDIPGPSSPLYSSAPSSIADFNTLLSFR